MDATAAAVVVSDRIGIGRFEEDAVGPGVDQIGLGPGRMSYREFATN